MAVKQESAMVRSCSAIGYTNRHKRESWKRVKILVSVKQDKCRLWLAAMRRKDLNPPPDAVIYSIHFIGDENNIKQLYLLLLMK